MLKHRDIRNESTLTAATRLLRDRSNEARNLVPYFCCPFPDELLGSWISRVVVLNAEPSFVSFAATIGIHVNTSTYLADPANSGKYIRAISQAIGLDENAVICQFTTKSYWSAFRSMSREQSEKQKFRSISYLRICPYCLKDDTKNFGTAYVHRTHQLPSRACPHHSLLLQDSCGACGQPLLAAAELTLIPQRCRCGADVALTLKRERASKAWQALATFSHQALAFNQYRLPEPLGYIRRRRLSQTIKSK